MKELKFHPGILSLRIAGKEFQVKPDSCFAEQLSLLAEEAGRRAAIAASSKATGEEILEFLSYAIDSLVGEGTIELLFGEEEPDLFDLCDILSYLCDCFSEYRRERLARLNGEADFSYGEEEA